MYAYLQGLTESDQVLFGHQNDVSRSVGTKDELGDVHDVTGSVSGIFGIDSLALFGSEAGGTDAKSALENSINYSKKAAENGAIVTLSAHMPNFTSAKIKDNGDGTYDFFDCNFNESKDLSGDSLKKILPGGANFEKLPPLIERINREKRNSKNYILFLGSTGTESNQAPCLSLVQFQIEQGELVMTAYQRSSDANLGLPADIYHLYLISRQIELPLKSITLNLGNVHIYENNIDKTEQLLAGNENVKFELNV